MLIPSALFVSPFITSLFGGVIWLFEVNSKVEILLLLSAIVFLFISITFFFIRRKNKYRPIIYTVSLFIFLVFSYFLITYITWLSGGKPGMVLYSGPQKEYHYINMFVSASFLMALLLSVIKKSTFEIFLEKVTQRKYLLFTVHSISALFIIISIIIWYNYITLPPYEFG